MKIKGGGTSKRKKTPQLKYTTNIASLTKSTNMFGKRILKHTLLPVFSIEVEKKQTPGKEYVTYCNYTCT